MSGEPKSRPTVLVPLRHRGSFLSHLFPGDGHGGLVFPTLAHHAVGETLDLELTFLQEQRSYRIKGTVRFVGDPQEPGGPPSVGVAFPASEKATLDLMVDFAHGKDVAFTERADTRFPVALQISYRTDSAFITDVTDDVSQNGAFIVTDRDIPVGTVMPLKLRVPGALLPLRVQGEVVWQRREAPAGVGVRFVVEKERTRRRLDGLVAKLRARALAEVGERMALGREKSRPPGA